MPLHILSKTALTACLTSVLLAVTTNAFAAPANSLGFPDAEPAIQIEEGPALVQGEFTLAPLGFIRFCMTYPADCKPVGSDVVELTPERQAELQRVNASVNRRIAPQPDRPNADIWSLNVRSGDCDEYAAQKRHDLIELGWPQGSLLFAAVNAPTGENHLVLIVRTSAGELVLDNLHGNILPVQASYYRRLKMQSFTNPSFWVEAKSTPTAMARAGTVQKVAQATRQQQVAARSQKNASASRGNGSPMENSSSQDWPTIQVADLRGVSRPELRGMILADTDASNGVVNDGSIMNPGQPMPDVRID